MFSFFSFQLQGNPKSRWCSGLCVGLQRTGLGVPDSGRPHLHPGLHFRRHLHQLCGGHVQPQEPAGNLPDLLVSGHHPDRSGEGVLAAGHPAISPGLWVGSAAPCPCLCPCPCSCPSPCSLSLVLAHCPVLVLLLFALVFLLVLLPVLVLVLLHVLLLVLIFVLLFVHVLLLVLLLVFVLVLLLVLLLVLVLLRVLARREARIAQWLSLIHI